MIFLAARVPTRPAAAWILPPLLLLFIAALCRNARMEQSPDNFEGVLGRIRPLNVLGLILISVSAIVVYAGFQTLDLLVPTNMVLYLITMPLGFWFFFRRLWVIFRPRNA